MLEKTDGVIAAYPHGDTQKVYIRTKKTGVFSKDSITKLIQKDRRFKVLTFASKVLVKKQPKPVSKS